MNEVDTYLAGLAAPERKALEHIRALVRQLVPEAEEGISYGMPGFHYKNRYMLGFNAFKDHLSFFPTAEPVEVFKDRLGAYKLSKGTIQFTLDHPLPDKLIKDIILQRKNSLEHSKKH